MFVLKVGLFIYSLGLYDFCRPLETFYFAVCNISYVKHRHLDK